MRGTPESAASVRCGSAGQGVREMRGGAAWQEGEPAARLRYRRLESRGTRGAASLPQSVSAGAAAEAAEAEQGGGAEEGGGGGGGLGDGDELDHAGDGGVDDVAGAEEGAAVVGVEADLGELIGGDAGAAGIGEEEAVLGRVVVAIHGLAVD